MREPADLTRIRRFMHALGAASREPARAYLTGGATAVLHGWRPRMIDERDELCRRHADLRRR
jgi:hypothetical protein